VAGEESKPLTTKGSCRFPLFEKAPGFCFSPASRKASQDSLFHFYQIKGIKSKNRHLQRRELHHDRHLAGRAEYP
jgi:hypothetical protein